MINCICAILGMDSKRIVKKYLEREKENKMVEGSDEFDQTLRSTVIFKRQNIKDSYLRSHKG